MGHEIRETTPTLAFGDLPRVIRAFIAGIDHAVEIGVDITSVIEAVAVAIAGLTLDDYFDTPTAEHSGVVRGLIGDLQSPLARPVSTGEDRGHQLFGDETEVIFQILGLIIERTTGAEISHLHILL